jgi:coenzyme PQQ biosynthesis enzyme PqqE
MPTPDQLERANRIISAAEARLRGKIRIDSVTADYYATYPKACMGGWGRRLMLIDPAGRALPCHAAGVIPGLVFDTTRERSLEWIWRESPAFQKFRGEAWMREPCRGCERRSEDFGGCRCQSFLLAGDAARRTRLFTRAHTLSNRTGTTGALSQNALSIFQSATGATVSVQNKVNSEEVAPAPGVARRAALTTPVVTSVTYLGLPLRAMFLGD